MVKTAVDAVEGDGVVANRRHRNNVNERQTATCWATCGAPAVDNTLFSRVLLLSVCVTPGAPHRITPCLLPRFHTSICTFAPHTTVNQWKIISCAPAHHNAPEKATSFLPSLCVNGVLLTRCINPAMLRCCWNDIILGSLCRFFNKREERAPGRRISGAVSVLAALLVLLFSRCFCSVLFYSYRL